MLTLRRYQVAALDALRNAFRRGLTRVVLYSPTGSGKTLMALEMIRSAVAKGSRVLFVCDRIQLVKQASVQFAKAGIHHGIVQGANTRSLHANVLVCCIKSLMKRGLPDADLIVIDEAHAAASSAAYHKLLGRYNAVRTVGLTATPFSRGMGKTHEWGTLFEDLVAAATIPELIREGFLVDVDIYAPTEPDLSGVRIVAGDYHETELGEAIDKPALIGDIVSHWHRLAKGKPTVCFATNIPHSKHIVEQFRASGVSAEHIDCYTPEEERQAILGRVNSGQTRVISNVSILAEGWDQPSVEVMICARPTRSLIRWIQMAGRILRPFDGKTRALILDHSGSAKDLGYPTEELPLILDDGKPKQAGTSRKKERAAQLCVSCQFLKPAGVHTCPACGFAPERKNEVEVSEGTLSKMERFRKMKGQDKGRLFAELKTISTARGWSKGRLAHVFRDLTGVWPNHYADVEPVPATQDTLQAVRHLAIRFVKSKAKDEANERDFALGVPGDCRVSAQAAGALRQRESDLSQGEIV